MTALSKKYSIYLAGIAGAGQNGVATITIAKGRPTPGRVVMHVSNSLHARRHVTL